MVRGEMKMPYEQGRVKIIRGKDTEIRTKLMENHEIYNSCEAYILLI